MSFTRAVLNIFRPTTYKVIVTFHYPASHQPQAPSLDTKTLTMSPTPTPPIAILGAGPSGLVLGRLLEKQNIDYIIFESDTNSSVVHQGGSLDIHKGSGQLALEEAGLLDEFQKQARWDCITTMADKQGNVVMSFAQESDRPEIDRKALRQILLDSIPERRVRWGCKVEKVMKEENGTMSVCLKNGSVESGFRLVVGADGAWSKARSLVILIIQLT